MKQYIQEFASINKFYDYLCNTPFNAAFENKDRSSTKFDIGFSKTGSYDEAVGLLLNGWSAESKKLTQMLKASSKPMPCAAYRNVLSVHGYQPVVPLYLAGVPTNMINRQLVAIKSKVVNVTKMVGYAAYVSTDTIERESIKAMQVVQKLEAQGYRVNLSIVLGTYKDNTEVVCKVKIKNANEKLNVSKLSFPMVHPSMLRRLMFRYIEVCPNVTHGFVHGYGKASSYNAMKNAFKKDIVLPSVWDKDVTKINSLDDLVAMAPCHDDTIF